MDEVKTGVENLEDVLVGSHDLEKVDKEKYLGDIISVDGRNRKNTTSRKGKAVGIINQITSILNFKSPQSYMKISQNEKTN